MGSNFLYVLLGFIIVATVGGALVSGYTFVYLRLIKHKSRKMLVPFATITVSWLVSIIVSVMFVAHLGLLPFVATITLLLLLTSLLLSKNLLGLTWKQAMFYSLGFSVIINPVWYFLFTG